MMKYRNDTARTFASVWFPLAFVVLVTPGSADARQEPTTTEEATVPVYEVRDVEELGLWTSVKWAFQWYVNPRALTDVALLHAYELSTVCKAVGQIRDPRAFGRAASAHGTEDPSCRSRNAQLYRGNSRKVLLG